MLGATVNDTSVKLTGFQTPFRRDRNENGGGVSIYISNQLSGKRRRELEHPNIELLWIEIYSISHRPLLLGCCCRPPNSTMAFFGKLEAVLDDVADRDILLLGEIVFPKRSVKGQ